eukprot:874166-Prorocentrum_minimum.AAC.1
MGQRGPPRGPLHPEAFGDGAQRAAPERRVPAVPHVVRGGRQHLLGGEGGGGTGGPQELLVRHVVRRRPRGPISQPRPHCSLHCSQRRRPQL